MWSEATSRSAVLEFRHIVKSFPGQVAVDDVSFDVYPGEIHGLVGENGAGKSTLIKILAGEHAADSGEIRLEGRAFNSNHPSEATDKGIGFIHQIPALVPALSVAENVSLGLCYARQKTGLISWSAQHRSTRSVLDKVGLTHVDPRRRLEDLSLHERQLVAVARVLTIKLRAVVFDEVTAPLTELEVTRLFKIIREIRDQDVGIIYISHRLGEVFELADRVTVMKNGAHVATEAVSDLSATSLTQLIIGKEPAERFESESVPVGSRAVLSLDRVTDVLLSEVSLDLHEGEILGLAGLGGSGRTNIAEIVFGARQPDSGHVLLNGEEVRFRHPADAVAKGVGLVTEDRQHDGFLANAPIWKNISLPWLRRFRRGLLLSLERERQVAREAVERFDVRARSIRMPMSDLSGGNQQKAILAKWLSQPLQVLLLDEPTHGVDVGAKEQIYRVIGDIAAKGIPVILISSDLDELEGLCSRVLVLVEGRIVDELRSDDITAANMLGALYAER